MYLTWKTKIWSQNHLSRRFGKYSFQTMTNEYFEIINSKWSKSGEKIIQFWNFGFGLWVWSSKIFLAFFEVFDASGMQEIIYISELYFTTKNYRRWSSNLVHCEIYITDRVLNIYDWQKIHFWKIHFLSPLKFWQPYNFVGLTCWQNKQKNSSK